MNDGVMTYEDWLRSRVYYDGKDGFVTLLCKDVLEIADCIERLKESNANQRIQDVKNNYTPQTDKDKMVCPNCGRSDYIRSFEKDFGIKNSEYRYKCINCNTYIKDTLQSKISSCKECKVYAECPDADSDVSSLCGMQIDCGWGEPNE